MNPNHIYQLLEDYSCSEKIIDKIAIGPVWTICQIHGQTGLAMSPVTQTRTLPWPGTLAGKRLAEIVPWINQWEPYAASVAMAAINCSLNQYPKPTGIALEALTGNANLSVFEHFLKQLKHKKIIIIGHYPGIERYINDYDIQVLERRPIENDYPDQAAEFLIPQADWVFITASSITNKTFPRIMQLAQHATTVLMGPTTPWLPELHEFGVDYLAGIDVMDAEMLYQTAVEGGGVRIFDTAVRYRVVQLTADISKQWLKNLISISFGQKQNLTVAMDQWYGSGKSARFPDYATLNQLTIRLSRLDSSYKKLWDVHH